VTVRQSRSTRLTVVKLGGELLENASRLRKLTLALAKRSSQEPIVIVHGGGREVDADMAKHGIVKSSVDGLRITNKETLPIVVGVLAGRVNTQLVAALVYAGASAVGLTGADGALVPVRRVKAYRTSSGNKVDLGYVGSPKKTGRPNLLFDLLKHNHLPVVASVSSGPRGQLFNVNADTLASNLAIRLGARQLLIAGSTAGVLDGTGKTIPEIDGNTITRLIKQGNASAGMVAKLQACRSALQNGVAAVSIVNGRSSPEKLFKRKADTTIIT
jgi:acetylglutamate kinase